MLGQRATTEAVDVALQHGHLLLVCRMQLQFKEVEKEANSEHLPPNPIPRYMYNERISGVRGKPSATHKGGGFLLFGIWGGDLEHGHTCHQEEWLVLKDFNTVRLPVWLWLRIGYYLWGSPTKGFYSRAEMIV